MFTLTYIVLVDSQDKTIKIQRQNFSVYNWHGSQVILFKKGFLCQVKSNQIIMLALKSFNFSKHL